MVGVGHVVVSRTPSGRAPASAIRAGAVFFSSTELSSCGILEDISSFHRPLIADTAPAPGLSAAKAPTNTIQQNAILRTIAASAIGRVSRPFPIHLEAGSAQ